MYEDKKHKGIKRFYIVANLSILLLLASAICLLFLWSYRQASQEHAVELHKEILRSKHEFIQDAVNRTIQEIELARTRCVERLHGPCDEEAIKEKLRERIRSIRLKDNGYLWINAILNYAGGDNYAYRFVHPNLPETEGMMLSTRMQDIKGNFPYLEELEGVKKDGELFFDYWFKKMDSDEIQHKLTYARLYQPYDWIVATGVYLDDVDALVQSGATRWAEKIRRDVAIAVAITGIASAFAWLLSLVVAKRVDAMYAFFLNEVTKRQKELSRHQEILEDQVRERTASLQKSEERYRSLVQKVPTAIVLHDGQGQIVESNALARKLLGLSADQLLGKELFDPQWRFLREDGSAMPVAEYPVSKVLSTRQSLRDYVVGIHRATREPSAWLLVNADPELDDCGTITRVVVSFVDITKRRQAETDLRKSEARLRELFNKAAIPLCFVNKDTGALVVNEGFQQVFGYLNDDLPTLEEWWPLAYPDPVYREWVLATCESELKWATENNTHLRPIEYRVTCKTGEVLIMVVSGSAIGDEFLLTFFDVTDRKQAEQEIQTLNRELEKRVAERTSELERANKELEAFAYSVSHDLRAPLRHIDGFLELLQKQMGPALDEQSRHYMGTISNAAQKMGRLIDDLLSFSRMGRHTLSRHKVALEEVAHNILREFRPDTVGRKIDWRIGNLPEVSGDEAMLRVALMNLISNALKFTRSREKAVIEIGTRPDQTGEAVIFVRDNGVGFDMAYSDKLFGVFQRLHHADDFEGTGIGLANVHRIIERHGGRTWAEGKTDQGATFYFSLP